MGKLVHQTVTTYLDSGGDIHGVCTCGNAYPLQAGTQTNVVTLAMHISMQNRNEALDA